MRFFAAFIVLNFTLAVFSSLSKSEDFVRDDDFNSVQAELNSYEKKVTAETVREEARVTDEWKNYQSKVEKEWSDKLIPERKTYVEYSDDFSGRIKVDYETGEVVVEQLEPATNPNDKARAEASISAQLKRLIAKDKNSPLPTLDATKQDQDQITVAAPVSEKGTDGVERKRYSYSFKMPENYLQNRLKAILPWVKEWASKNSMNPSLILAVIRQESAFNPKARSWIPAFGLMQIVPGSAGKEVMQKLSGKSITPDETTLYEPRSNIMFGSTYLKILQGTFATTKNELNRNYLVICAYNWGPGRIAKAIAKGRIHPNGDSATLFNELQQILPAETQGYLTRVSGFFKQFLEAQTTPNGKSES